MRRNIVLLTLTGLLAWMMPQTAKADNFLQNSNNFTAIVIDKDRVQFTLPTQYDGNQNEGISDGKVRVTINDGEPQDFLRWWLTKYNDLTSDSESGTINIKGFLDGTYQLVGKVKGGYKTFGPNSTISFTVAPNDDDDDHFTTTVIWTVPYELRGKTLKFEVWAKSEDVYNTWYMPSENGWKTMLTWDCPEAPEVSVSLSEPMMAIQNGHVNEQTMTYTINARSVKSAELHYTDALTNESHTRQLENKLVGQAYIPADRPYKDIYVSAMVVDAEGNTLSNAVTSEHQKSFMLHYPKRLDCVIKENGQVELSWEVDNADQEDLSDGDNFELQRNLTGSTVSTDPYWTPVDGSVVFQQGQSRYTITDNLIEQYKGNKVTYRVRRSYTSAWRWADNSGFSICSLPTDLVLPAINNVTVRRDSTSWNGESHVTRFAFDLIQEKYEPIDSLGRYILRSTDDFKNFVDLVNSGQTKLGAVMVSDIDASNLNVMIGNTEAKAYQGVFNGNGHTLTVNINASSAYAAPFRYVGNATIKDLHIAGLVNTSAQFAAGFIGYGKAPNTTVTIENCRSSVTIRSSLGSNNANGGFVGAVDNTAIIRNCKFDGSFEGKSSECNGGFIGWVYGQANIENCLFAPDHIDTRFNQCHTWGRTPGLSGKGLTVTNSYATKEYSKYSAWIIIHTAADWQRFVQAVDEAQNQYDVNAIMYADISVTTKVGLERNKAFRGTFDGNGHTLNVNINSTEDGTTPFRFVTNTATIKNLRVTGSVKGGIHTAGLIGGVNASPIINLERVWVSANVTSTSTHVGGVIGHANIATVNVSDTRFDGDMVTNNSSGSYAGAIIGWSERNNWTFHRVQYCAPKKATANIIWFCADFSSHSAQAWGSNGNSSLTVTNTSWSDWKVTYYNKTNQNEVVNLMNGEKSGSWHIVDGQAAPVMETTVLYGIYAGDLSPTELLSALGSQWEIRDNEVVPVVSDPVAVRDSHTTVWDPRAKLQLRINMHGEGGVESTLVDLSDNEEATQKHQFSQALTRKCVDYTFDLILRRGNSPLKINGIEGDSLVVAVKKTDDMQDYTFRNSNRITQLEATKKQSSVELTWETSGGDHDYFRVLRRKHGAETWTDTIATNLIQQFYEDKTVLVQQMYDYRVESVYQCEGTYVEALTCTGQCETTGRIDGYLRMADGTALAGVEVECRPESTIIGADAVYRTTTDEAGYFKFEGLPYQGSGKYYVTVPTSGDMGSYTAPNALGEVSFTPSSNWTQEFNFYLDTYYIYSGNVYYRDTSIPVPGVSFLLDGKEMHDGSKHVITTDTQGAFELSIPRGAHSVRAVKDGHYFANDGFLLKPDAAPSDTLYNFTKNVANVFLWDSTTVVLRGRVVGGDAQGSLPLGSSLSKNNLGDSLKIVMQLEGDNTSWLIRKQDDETVKNANYAVAFGEDNRDTTRVEVTRHTLTIHPDAKTGEYQIALHPAKYKVIEVSAQGYATLFQQGKVGETIDLFFKKNGEVCEYNRIYHAVPDLEVTQFNPRNEPYYGSKQFSATDNIGNKATITTWYYRHLENGDSIGTYAFGYPLFMAGSPYGWMLQACEKYYWNNVVTNNVDIVNLNSGTVTIKNAMLSKGEAETVTLDETGGGSYVFTPDNSTFLLTDEAALKNVSITLEYNQGFYDVKPLNGGIMRGYVMATTPKKEGRKGIMAGQPRLFDVLRDPPGGGSSAYIEEGSKLSYSYTADLKGSAGVTFSLSQGNNANIYNGTVIVPGMGVAGTEAGTFIETSKKNVFSIDATTYFGFGWTYTYNMDVTERIQTSSGKKWVGPKADLFIGMTDEVVVEDGIAVRVIPDSVYQLLKTHEGGTFQVTDASGNTAKVKVPTGTMKVLAQGKDSNDATVWLVRDEVMTAGLRLNSTFVHSQHYIENELLPDLIKTRNAMLLPPGTSDDYAKQLANRQGYPAYISKVAEDHEDFGFDYTVVEPDNPNVYHGDSISALNQTVLTWLQFLAKNEETKLSVTQSNLVKRYDFDGAASIQYSETFTGTENNSRYLQYPGINNLGQVTSGVTSVLKTFVETCKHWFEVNGKNISNKPENADVESLWDADLFTEIKAGGTYLSLSIMPTMSLNFNDKNSMTETQSKKIGFTLSASSKSSMTVDVYRTASVYTMDTTATAFNKMTYELLEDLRTGKLGSNPTSYVGYNEKVFSNFVYRTRAGVTCEPYEDERLTKWYQPGTVMDVATIPADKPRIWIDEPVVSNVPYDEPARFKLHFANETDYPERASLIFNYFLLASSNPNGAKVYVDGTPINSQGVNIVLYPCRDKNNDVVVFTKEIEVYPGTEFDYNDLTLCIYDPEDPNRVFSCNFSAHFVPTAGKVSVSSPSNNWVMNTESPYDGQRQGWYMPVKIDGFNTNYRGFDHIELQYKLSTQGDKDWVNVCSYYANDSLRAKASGVTDTIPNSGTIIAKFYGETDPVEQYYDLRAVNYCRHAGGFLTGMSPVLKGIKDTRRPEIFGTPEPVDGILGIGEDLKLTFSEPIAGNYLSKINNFELLGTPTNNDISTSTSLTFDGENSIASSQGSRNLAGKSFTVDVMLNPATDKGDMTVFLHGGEENGLKFGLTADRHLTAKVNGQVATSDSIVKFNGILQEVAYVLDQSGDSMTVNFFDGSKQIGSTPLSGKYDNTGTLCLGHDIWEQDKNYKGDMLEFRLWNRALTPSDLNEYGKKQLTGYESGLIDYYHLNEGTGVISYDRAPGASDMLLQYTNWKRPAGISMKIDGKQGLRLKPDKFVRSSGHDYTLMFWFRLTGSQGTLFSNGEAKGQDPTANGQLNIGAEDGGLYIRSDGWQQYINSFVSDGEWHHFVMTVSRSRNVANVYIDQNMVEAFAAENMGGISGDHIALGATYVDKNTPTQVMTGNIDEVGMFESVLPEQLLNEFSVHTPMGELSSLMAYLDFGRSVRQDNNTMRLEPTGISIKRYKDNQGNIVERRDTLIASIDDHFVDRNIYAPMVSNSQLENLNFSYVTNGNQLLVNIKEPDYTIEKTNVYLTVKEVPDLQGNLMVSPVTMNVYVYRNPLNWDVKRITRNIGYGEGLTFEATIKNLSSNRQNYELNELPVWITASQTSGYISALGEQTITFTVSPYINIGTYNEQIEVIGGNGMSEPLFLTLNVRGEEPEWMVSDQLKQLNQTMMMVTRVKIDGVVARSTEDLLGVFDESQQCLGVAHVEVDNTANANEALTYLTIYGYINPDGTTPTLNFRFFDALTGHVYTLKPLSGEQYTFRRDTLVGSATVPVELVNEYYDLEWLKLKKGWNWVTFCVTPKRGTTVSQFLDGLTVWEPGDIVMTTNGTTTQKYTCRQSKTAARGYQWDNADEPIEIDPTRMYSVYSMNDKMVHVEGYWSYAKVTVHKDWNRLGYIPLINLPLAQALSGYTDEASEGDVIKSQDAFAVATRTATGLVWKGSLQHMETSKGYMLKRQSESEASFYYPLYRVNNRYSGTTNTPIRAAVSAVSTATTMNIVASVSGIEVEEGDLLVAYLGCERMAESSADEEQHYFLNIGSDVKNTETIYFVIERDGKSVATTGSNIRYEANQVLGTPNQPTDICFMTLDQMPHDGQWYTTAGIRLAKKPTRSGLYIHNGKVIVIK